MPQQRTMPARILALGRVPSMAHYLQAPELREEWQTPSLDHHAAAVVGARCECAGLVPTVELAAEVVSAHLPQWTSFEPKVAANSVPPRRAVRKH